MFSWLYQGCVDYLFGVSGQQQYTRVLTELQQEQKVRQLRQLSERASLSDEEVLSRVCNLLDYIDLHNTQDDDLAEASQRRLCERILELFIRHPHVLEKDSAVRKWVRESLSDLIDKSQLQRHDRDNYFK